VAKIIVLGAGPVGLATSMLLAHDGHDVTVLEKDSQTPPAVGEDAWEGWERKGVAQFRLGHYMQARVRHLLDAELPDVRDEILACGGVRYSILDSLLFGLDDTSPRDGDDRFETVTARRPILESAFARVAENTPGVKIVRGVNVEGPVTDGSIVDGVPHVVGVRTRDGEEMGADLVVDAGGRRSNYVEWAKAVGARPPYEEAFDAGFAYYSRHYRSSDGTLPEVRGRLVNMFSTISVLTLPADSGTWVCFIVGSAGDKPLKALRHNEVWERVMRAVPHVAHWIDGEPLSDVHPMAGVSDRYRRFVQDGKPSLTGMVAVGDAWACTNPQAGRGVSTGLGGALALRDVVRDHADSPLDLALALDRELEERCAPWYRFQVVQDRDRHVAVQAAIEGRATSAPGDVDNPVTQMVRAFGIAAQYDEEVARVFAEVFSCLTHPAVALGRPGLMDRILTVAAGKAPKPVAGPTREQLLELLAG
jgi:2-polyprenyl-6-methoxyphenol hydroxylase-like FAD-dependent oxidoreductase